MFFEETIKSKNGGFSIEYLSLDHVGCYVFDGDELQFIAEDMPIYEFRKQVLYGENRNAHLIDMFKTNMNNNVYYWRDDEENRDFITIYSPFPVHSYFA